MTAANPKIPMPNTYKDGKLSQGKFAWGMAMGLAQPSLPTVNVPLRSFVADEKFWVTGVAVQKDGILLSTFSDPYPDASGNQVRYYGEVKFPFPKSGVPPTDDFVKTVAELMTVQPADDSAQPVQAAAPAAPAQAPAPAPIAAIAPPPPPTDAPPPTIAVGQTRDQVTAAFGQPTRVAKLGAKEILYYKDMKVTLTNGKVSNVE